MLAVFKRVTRTREILDLTAPAQHDDDGIVERWLRESTARTEPEAPARAPRREEPVA